MHFYDTCKKEVHVGHRSLCHLNKKELDKKWDSLKGTYISFVELKSIATRLGWNKEKQIVEASQECYVEYIVVNITLFD